MKVNNNARFWSKVFRTRYEMVVAICDEDLLGERLVAKRFDVKVSEKFYGGRIIDCDTAIKLMESATIGNLFGKNIVALAEKHGFVSKENVLYIKKVPHAQFVKMVE